MGSIFGKQHNCGFDSILLAVPVEITSYVAIWCVDKRSTKRQTRQAAIYAIRIWLVWYCFGAGNKKTPDVVAKNIEFNNTSQRLYQTSMALKYSGNARSEKWREFRYYSRSSC